MNAPIPRLVIRSLLLFPHANLRRTAPLNRRPSSLFSQLMIKMPIDIDPRKAFDTGSTYTVITFEIGIAAFGVAGEMAFDAKARLR